MMRITTNKTSLVLTARLGGRLERPWMRGLEQRWHGVFVRPDPAGAGIMKNWRGCIGSCVVCFYLVGCAAEQRRFTGFLDDYSILKPHATIPDALVYWSPDLDPRQYRAVIVEPVEIQFMNRGDEKRAKPEEVAAFRRFVTEELTKAISKHMAIATEPGANVLRLRLQIANLQFTRSVGEPRYPWLPPDHALGTANIETDARDSLSGELVVAYVSPRGRGEIYTPHILAGPPDSWEAAKEVISDRIVTWTDHAARYFEPELKRNQAAAGSLVKRRQIPAIYGPQAVN